MQLVQVEENVWDVITTALKKQLGTATYNSWIRPLSARVENAVLILTAPTKFIRDWVDSNYKHKFRVLAGGLVKDVRIEITAAPKPVLVSSQPEEKVIELVQYKDSVGSRVDPRYTFDNYITDTTNELAFAAAKRVAELGEKSGFSPLFIHSSVGLGKTHLLNAIANANKNRNVVYLSAEKFMHQFLRAIRERNLVEFKDQLRSADILMIDDLQFVVGKEASQEELFQTFNSIIESGKQIVITADRYPAQFDAMPERMRSRLSSGLVVDVAPAGQELRFKIIKAKAAASGLALSDEILQYLASNITSNIRELEGALNRIIARATLIKSEVNLDNAKVWVSDLLKQNTKTVTVEGIQSMVAEKYNLTTKELLSGSRAADIAKARHIAMYLAKKLTTKSLPEIGKLFGGKDHTTVMHACKKVEGLITNDKTLELELDAISTKIKY